MTKEERQEVLYTRLLRKTDLYQLGKTLVQATKPFPDKEQKMAIRRQIVYPILQDAKIIPQGYVLSKKKEKVLITYGYDLMKQAIDQFIEDLNA